jgi:hypothetical protein
MTTTRLVRALRLRAENDGCGLVHGGMDDGSRGCCGLCCGSIEEGGWKVCVID